MTPELGDAEISVDTVIAVGLNVALDRAYNLGPETECKRKFFEVLL